MHSFIEVNWVPVSSVHWRSKWLRCTYQLGSYPTWGEVMGKEKGRQVLTRRELGAVKARTCICLSGESGLFKMVELEEVGEYVLSLWKIKKKICFVREENETNFEKS